MYRYKVQYMITKELSSLITVWTMLLLLEFFPQSAAERRQMSTPTPNIAIATMNGVKCKPGFWSDIGGATINEMKLPRNTATACKMSTMSGVRVRRHWREFAVSVGIQSCLAGSQMPS